MEKGAMEEISMDKRDYEDILNGRTDLPISAEEWRERFRTMIKAGGSIWLYEPDGAICHVATLSAEGQLGFERIT